MDLKSDKIQISSIYSKLTFVFIFLAFLLVVVIAYFSMSKAIIYVTPVKKDVSVEFITTVKDCEDCLIAENEVEGVVIQQIVEAEKEFKTSGQKVVPKEDNIVGTVTIFNNYSSDQPLVSTTRLLSENEILFRINQTVLVPSGGQVQVEVYPDNPEDIEGNILAPTKFTIPGLWPGIQDKIYAESTEEFSTEGSTVNYVTQDDIDAGKKVLIDDLYDQVLDEILAIDGSEQLTILASKEVIQSVTEKEVNQIADEFKMSVRIKVNVVTFEQDNVVEVIEQELRKQVEEGHELISIDLDSISYSIEKIDLIDNVANIKVKASGKAIIKIESNILNKKFFSGKKEEYIRKELIENDSISEVSIKFKPEWMSRMPYLKDHITVIIER